MHIPHWARIAFSVGVLLLILWRVPAHALWMAFQKVDASWLGPALASSIAALALRTLKWQRLLVCANSRVLPGVVTRSLFGGFALGMVTPGRLGEFGRCLFIPEAERALILPLNILDRALDSWAIATYAVASLFLAGGRPEGVFAAAIWLACLPLVLGLPRLLAIGGDAGWWSETFRVQLRSSRLALRKIRIATFAGWALTSTAFDLLTFFFLLRAFHPATFTIALVTFPWIVMASGIPLSIGGLGLREGAAVWLLARYAISAAVATDVALLCFTLFIMLPALLGGAWLLADSPYTEPERSMVGATQIGIGQRK